MSNRYREASISGARKPADPEQQIQKLTARLNALERELQAVGSGSQPHESHGGAMLDPKWQCSKCSYMLGIYDKEADVVRTKYKEHIVYVQLGEKGWIQVVCRGCAAVNVLHFTPDEEPGAEPG